MNHALIDEKSSPDQYSPLWPTLHASAVAAATDTRIGAGRAAGHNRVPDSLPIRRGQKSLTRPFLSQSP